MQLGEKMQIFLNEFQIIYVGTITLPMGRSLILFFFSLG